MRIEKLSRKAVTVAMLATALLVSACGGGGSDDGPCGGAGTLTISVSYEVNGRVYGPRDSILVARSLPITPRPVAVDLPAACSGKLSWRVRSNLGSLPTGLVLDETTGQVSGTATTGRSFGLTATASVQGYPGSVTEDFSILLLAN